MSSDILQQEQQHLDRTVVPLKEQLKSTQKELEEMMSTYEEGIKKLATDGSSLEEKMEEIGDLNKMMKSQAYNYKKNVILKRLNDQVNKPYFAKIDFKEQSETNPTSYYIGRYAHYDKDPKYHIVDWRAPLASVYYQNSEPKNNISYEVNINDENLKTFYGDLTARANFDIDDSKILAIYDNSLRIDLLKLRISQKSGGKLTDIVETIQETQNQIIRANPFKICIVQGTAGSGKTTIAVHRLSYILYTYQKQIKERDTLLISSSKVLINYVSSTLPELDVISVDRFTLEDIFSQSLIEQGFVVYKDSILPYKRKDTEALNSWDFLNFLNSYSHKLKLQIIEDLESEKFYDKLNLQSYFSRNVNTPIFDILNYMKENLETKYFILKKDLKKGNFTVEDEVDNLQDALSTIRQIQKQYPLKKIYKKVLMEYALDKNIDLEIEKEHYDIDDFSALFILGKLLFDATYKNKVYKQIIVDEAQDMGILNFMALKLMGFVSGFTILGDLNQSINGSGCIKNWNELDEIFDKNNVDFFEIKVSYRTTKQVIALAKSILQKFEENTHLPVAFEREGEIPVISKFENREKIIEKIVSEIIQKRAGGDHRAVAIIECDKQKFEGTKLKIAEQIPTLEPIYSSFENFSDSATYLINADLVKGLEFDTVYIIDPNYTIYPKTLVNSKKLFVLTTRAINTLKIYYTNKLSSLLD